jgi:branched-chain amino acid transport system ATP-binding protein
MATEQSPAAGFLSTDGTEPLLSTERLVVGYGAVEVLHGIDLEVLPGTIAAVVGANGAGKTTLLRTLSGLLRPTSGHIRFAGEELRGVPVHQMVRRGIAHVPEGRGVVAELTVDENLRLGGLWRRDREDAGRALDEVYDLFPPLAERRKHAGHQLSGGERQMLAIGRALIARPRLMLLDEPSLGLAPRVVAQIMSLLRRLRDETGLTVLLVEQNVRSALSVADTAVVVALGRVVIATDAKTMRADEGLRQAYLGF